MATLERFSTPEQELEYLRERVRIKESELEVGKDPFEKERLAKREITHYKEVPSEHVLEEKYDMPETTVLQETLRLEPEEHDVQVDELIRMIQERGIKNTLKVISKMNSAHLEDDLHRALVAYVSEGLPSELKKGSEVYKLIDTVLYEVSLASQTAEDQDKELQRLLVSMEQFYLGMLSVVKKKGSFAVEIAVAEGGEEVIFYVAVPRKDADLFQKHIIATFPSAHMEEARGDYNVFADGGFHVGSYATLEKAPVYPVKGYEEFSHDPLNIILSAFSKLKKHGEGAAIQFVIGDDGDVYSKQYKSILDNIRSGKKAGKAIKHGMSPFSEAVDLAGSSLKDAVFSSKKDPNKENVVDEIALENITRKVNSRIVPVNIRIIASAPEAQRAEEIMDTIASSFNQFEEPQGNSLKFIKQNGAALREFLHAFTFRTLNHKKVLPLSVNELIGMYHLTGQGVSSSRELKQARSKQVASPIEVSADDGIILGNNIFGGEKTPVHFSREDRMRHFYEIGQTGTGKTNLMKNMIIQDIQNGEGCCYIDPHGSDIVDVLAAVPPERQQDVIYFDPAHMDTPMGLNMMEFNPEFPEQKTFVVNEIFSIFEKLFLAKSPESLGPMFEQYFRNAAMLVLEGMPQGTATMADIPKVLANTEFRKALLSNSKNSMINQFWEEIAEQAGGDASLENIVPYITAKTDIFLSNDIMRPIISQPTSAFNFRDIMDNKKILLVNLSKGRLGDINSELLGLIIVGKFLQAALSRVDVVASGGQIADFFLYIDEFQNFTTPSIATILSEARKYRLSLNIAHQFIAQLDDRIKDSVFGNVGTKCVFRVGNEDAQYLESQFQPEFGASDIAGLDNFNAYISLLVGGKPIRPFNMVTLPPSPVDFEKVEQLKQMSYDRYGRNREEVEAEIVARYARD